MPYLRGNWFELPASQSHNFFVVYVYFILICPFTINCLTSLKENFVCGHYMWVPLPYLYIERSNPRAAVIQLIPFRQHQNPTGRPRIIPRIYLFLRRVCLLRIVCLLRGSAFWGGSASEGGGLPSEWGVMGLSFEGRVVCLLHGPMSRITDTCKTLP